MSEAGTRRTSQGTAFDNTFAVIELVAKLGPGTTARDLTTRLPLDRATVFRIVKHLVAEEYLVRTADLSGLALGRRVLSLRGLLPAPVSPSTPAPEPASQSAEPSPVAPGLTAH